MYSQYLYTYIDLNDTMHAFLTYIDKFVKKIERTAKKVTEVILPTLYLAPMFLGAYGFVSFVQWAS